MISNSFLDSIKDLRWLLILVVLLIILIELYICGISNFGNILYLKGESIIKSIDIYNVNFGINTMKEFSLIINLILIF